jgi:signal peptidase
VVKWLTNIILSLLILITCLLVLLPAVFSSSLAMVYSGSMAPVMPVGALAWMKSVDPAQIKVGDIIAFNPPWNEPDVTVSHRVIEVVEGETISFRTKGDANDAPDLDTIPVDHVLARVEFNIPNLGFVMGHVEEYTGNWYGLVLLIGLPSMLLIGSTMRDINFRLNPRKTRVRQRKKIMEQRRKRRFRS